MFEWQHKQNRGRRQEFREEFSFLLNNAIDPGIGLPGDRVYWLGKRRNFCAVRCALDGP
jgi:hypothetical protein